VSCERPGLNSYTEQAHNSEATIVSQYAERPKDNIKIDARSTRELLGVPDAVNVWYHLLNCQVPGIITCALVCVHATWRREC